jgi:hypothetical protein
MGKIILGVVVVFLSFTSLFADEAGSEALPIISAPDVKTDISDTDQIPTNMFKNFSLEQNSAEPYINNGVVRADSILKKTEEYLANQTAEVRQIITSTHEHLRGAVVNWSKPGYDFKGCTDNVLAFVLPLRMEQVIYLCSVLAYSNNVKAIAQTLIHESAHLSGFRNECAASVIEVLAMLSSGEGLAYENSYLDDCKIPH